MRGGSLMKKWRHKFKKWTMRTLELPADVVMDLPRITMIGQLHIYIENHKGVLRFSNEELRLRLKQGQLLIKGSDFVLKTILPEEILLEGKIDQVLYLDASGADTKRRNT
jgi:sporulation protein YqfC